MYRFPSQIKYPKQWERWRADVRATRPGVMPKSRTAAFLCSSHFDEGLIVQNDKRPRLRPYAIPTKFLNEKQVMYKLCFEPI